MKIIKMLMLIGVFLISCADPPPPPSDTTGDEFTTTEVFFDNDGNGIICYNYPIWAFKAKIKIDVRYFIYNEDKVLEEVEYWGNRQNFETWNGSCNVRVPTDGAFILAVSLEGECHDCCKSSHAGGCNSETEWRAGKPEFSGESKQIIAEENQGKDISVNLRWRGCEDCGCTPIF